MDDRHIEVEDLVKALPATNTRDRLGAARMLGAIGDVRAVPALLQALHDADGQVAWHAALSLAQLADVRVVAPLIQHLENAAAPAAGRAGAAKALGQLGDVRAIPPLRVALHDEDCTVVIQSANALVTLGDIESIDDIARLFDHPYDVVRTAAGDDMALLGVVGRNAALAVLQHGTVRARVAAAYGLGEWSDELALAGLVAALHDPAKAVGYAAADTLGKQGDPRAVEPLIHLLAQEHEEQSVRDSAADALRQIGGARAEGLLSALVRTSPYRDTRHWAIIALRDIGSERAVPTLEFARNNDLDAGVRALAESAIDELHKSRSAKD